MHAGMTTPATSSTTSANAALAQQRAAEEAARRAEEAREAQRAAREQAQQSQRTQAQEPQPGSPAVSGAARAKSPFALPQSSLFESLQAPPVQLQPNFKPNAATRLNGATAAHDDAAEAYANAEQRLNRELSAVGHTLTPAQQKQFKDEFWSLPENADIRAEEASTADELAKMLRRSEGVVSRAGGEEALLEANLSLAKSPKHADRAIAFAQRLDQSPELFEKLDAATEGDLATTLEEDLVATALPYAQAEIFARHSGAPEAVARQRALDDFNDLIGGFSAAKGVTGIGAQVTELQKNLVAAANGSFDAVQQQVDAWADASKLGKAFTAASVAQSLFAAGEDFAGGDLLNGLKNTAGGAQAGLQLAGQVLTTFDAASSSAGSLAGFAAKATPVLGLAADAIQLGQDIAELSDGAEAGEIVSLVGTSISLVGDVAGFVPVAGTAVDGVLGAVGGAVHLIGDLISGEDDPTAPDEAEMSELLQTTLGVAADEADTLVERGLDWEAARLGALGLKPNQVREVMIDESLRVDAHGQETTQALQTAIRLAASYGVRGDDAHTFIHDAVEALHDPEKASLNFELDQLSHALVQGYFAKDVEALQAAAEDTLPLFSEALVARLQTEGNGEVIWGAFDHHEP